MFDCAHDVAVAYLLAMQEARVQLPLDAFWSPTLRCKRLHVVLIQDVGKPGIPPGTVRSMVVGSTRSRVQIPPS